MPPPWRVKWGFAAEAGLRAIPWRDATAVDAAVIRFAATGEGNVVRHRSDPTTVYLREGRYKIRLAVDEAEAQLTVVYVWHNDRG